MESCKFDLERDCWKLIYSARVGIFEKFRTGIATGIGSRRVDVLNRMRNCPVLQYTSWITHKYGDFIHVENYEKRNLRNRDPFPCRFVFRMFL